MSRSLAKNFDNLLRVDDNTLSPEGNPNLASNRLIHYCGYLGLDNLAAIEFDPDAEPTL
jgi:hypothetical protein